MIRRSAGALELIDVSQELPALKRQQGKTHWVVKDRSGYRNSYSEVEQVCGLAARLPEPMSCQLRPVKSGSAADVSCEHVMNCLAAASDR